jgi:ubiquitin C-terminal hydrolase
MTSLGLINMGNTCYINSVIQSMRYLKNFVKLFREVTCKKSSSIVEPFIELLFADCDMSYLKQFIIKLARNNPEFRVTRQCDSHELYLYVVDSIYEVFKDQHNPFKGDLQSMVTCTLCGNVSTTCYPFVSLSFELPSTPSLNCTDLLDHFCTEEMLDTKIDCDKCKKKCTSQKHMSIKTYGTIVVMHLKRFSNMGTKNHTPINISKELPLGDEIYSLVSIVNHSGECFGGHYTAIVKRQNDTYLFCNDTCVNSLPTLPKESTQAYMLFYQKNYTNN